MRILVTGGYGQLGSELKFLSSFYNNFEWIFTDTDEFDLTDIKKIDIVNLTQLIGEKLAINVKKQVGIEIKEVPKSKKTGQLSIDRFFS